MIDKIQQYLKSKTDCYEIYYEDADKLKIYINKNKIDFATESRTEGVTVRVCKDKKLGMATTTNLSKYKECIDSALKIAKLNNNDGKFINFQSKLKASNAKGYNQKLLNQSAEELNIYLKDFISNIKKKDKNILLSDGAYSRYVGNARIINSEGVDAEKKSASNQIVDELILKDESIWAFDESKLPLNPKTVDEHADRLLSMLNSKKTKTEDIQLIFHPEALQSLMSHAFAYSVSAENVQNNRSFFTGKLNQQVFDKKITIRDNGTEKDLMGTEPFDDEGTPSQNTGLIANGMLNNVLHNTYTASQENAKSTGNCARSPGMIPSISTTNLIMEKGAKSFDKMLSEVKKGIYVRNLMGVHTMSEVTGEFSLGATEAHLIENGKIKHALKDTMIAGNFFDLMKDITLIENKLSHAGSGFYLPHVLSPKIKVIG